MSQPVDKNVLAERCEELEERRENNNLKDIL